MVYGLGTDDGRGRRLSPLSWGHRFGERISVILGEWLLWEQVYSIHDCGLGSRKYFSFPFDGEGTVKRGMSSFFPRFDSLTRVRKRNIRNKTLAAGFFYFGKAVSWEDVAVPAGSLCRSPSISATAFCKSPRAWTNPRRAWASERWASSTAVKSLRASPDP
jgi:hypothetical protein